MTKIDSSINGMTYGAAIRSEEDTTFSLRGVSDHLILSRYVCSNIVANIVTNIYMYVMRHVRT